MILERIVYKGEERYVVEAWYGDEDEMFVTVSKVVRCEDAPDIAASHVRDDPATEEATVQRLLDEASHWVIYGVLPGQSSAKGEEQGTEGEATPPLLMPD